MRTKCQRVLNPKTAADYGLSVTEAEAKAENTVEGGYVALVLQGMREVKETTEKSDEVMSILGRSAGQTIMDVAAKVLSDKERKLR